MPRTTGRGTLREFTCAKCGVIYVTRGRSQFCSRDCATAVLVQRRLKRALPQVTVTCRHCGTTVTVVGSKAVPYAARNGLTRSFCSKACYDASRVVPVPTYTCAHCGKLTERTKGASGGYIYSQRFCSRFCADEAQHTGSLDKNGYRIISVGRTQMSEHRFVMERMTGRELFDYETVHHRNGVRTDNRPENLELWLGRHAPGGRLEEVLAWYVRVLTDHGYHVTAP